MDLQKYTPQWIELNAINIENIQFRFRKDITPESVSSLAKSMAEDGQKFPVLLWHKNDGSKQLISGFRRVTAARSLNWGKVLAIVIPESDLGEEEALRLNFVENVERKTLTNLDIMFACRKLRDEEHKSNVVIGRLIGKSENQVRRYLKIADAPTDIQAKVAAGETTIKQAGNEQLAPGGEGSAQNDKMYVKSTKNGFNAILKFDRKHDNPDSIIAFANDLIKLAKEQARLLKAEARKAGKKVKGKGDKLKGSDLSASKSDLPLSEVEVTTPAITQNTQPANADSPAIKHILIEGRSRGQAGQTLDLRLAAYDKNSKKMDPAILTPAWDCSDNSVAELTTTSGHTIQLKLKSPGTCFIHARQGPLKATAGIEVFG